MRVKKLYKCQWDKKISGVCGGLGVYFNLDPAFFRLALLLLLIPTGVVLLPLIYMLASAILPEGPTHYIQPKCKRLYRSRVDRKISGVIGGLADFFKIDSNLLRLIVIAVCFVTLFFPILITYIIATSILPQNPSQ